jgi:hypothetical protein
MYTIEDFKKNYKFMDLVDKDVINILSSLVKNLNCKDTFEVKKGNFLLENSKKKYASNIEDWDKIRTFNKTILIKEDGIENYLQKLRKELNILTENNYDSVERKIIDLINEVKIKEEKNFDIFSLKIYELISNNLLYSTVYSKLYSNICDRFDNFKILLEEKFSNFDKLFDDIEYCSPDDNYDLFCDNNKNNEKRRANCYFFTNLIGYEKLDKNLFLIKLNYLYDILISKVNFEDMKNHVDEMSELIYIIISNSYKLIDNDNLNILIDKIKMVSSLKVKDYKSLTNKCLFKHMDLLDEII